MRWKQEAERYRREAADLRKRAAGDGDAALKHDQLVAAAEYEALAEAADKLVGTPFTKMLWPSRASRKAAKGPKG